MSKKNSKNNELSEQQKRKIELKQMKKMDIDHFKDDIFRLKQQLQQLIKNKHAIETKIQQNKDNNMKVTYKLEIELKKQEQSSHDLQNTLNSLKSKKEAEVLALQQKYDNEIQKNEGSKSQQKQQKVSERQKLEQKVNYLNKYPQRRIGYVKNMEQLDNQMEAMRISQQNDIGKIKNHYEETRVKLQQNTKQQIEKIKKTQIHRLEQKMTRDQFIKKQNQVMERQINLCKEQRIALQQECQEMSSVILGDKSKQFQHTLGSQANQTYERSLRIIKLESKLNKLKTHLAEETAKLQKQYSQLDGLYTKKYQQMNTKVTKIQGWLRIKSRDMKKLKACSQMVLNQRSNLQSYLLEVFYEHPQLDYKSQQNINPILRHLFAKINSRKPPVTYKNYLPQSNNHTLNSSLM